MKKLKSFLTDKDGVSQKDYLLVFSTVVFFLFLGMALVASLFGVIIQPIYIDLLNVAQPILLTIIGSVAGVEVVSTIKGNKETIPSEHQEVPSDEPLVNENIDKTGDGNDGIEKAVG